MKSHTSWAIDLERDVQNILSKGGDIKFIVPVSLRPSSYTASMKVQEYKILYTEED